MFEFEYLCDQPIIDLQQFPELNGNINGPSLIRGPAWLENPPAKYLLYFAHHEGHSIRLALADDLRGPWRLQQPPPLSLADSYFAQKEPALEDLHPEARRFIENKQDGNYPHIASPDVWVDNERQQIRLYYHGRLDNGQQRTRVAISSNGVDFIAREPILATSYLRLFRHDDWFYALTMPAQLYRSRDGLADFEAGPRLTDAPIRHHALLERDGHWYLFWTRVGDRPERILVSEIEMTGGWRDWRLAEPQDVHRAERDWEGGNLPPNASEYGAVSGRVNQLRDPAIFEEDGRIFLLYALAGEQGIGIGELHSV